MSSLQSAAAMPEAVLVTSSMNASSVPASESSDLSSEVVGGSLPSSVVALNTLALHQQARVVDLLAADEEVDDSLLLRLMEIGFLPGEPVRIVATGFPGADPLAVRVGQVTFALRSYEAAKVMVRLETQA